MIKHAILEEVKIMPRCKYCNELISRLDKDVCPYCGGLKPLEGNENMTEDLTKAFEKIEVDEEVPSHKKIVTFLLFIFLGIFGIGFFYLGYKKRGLITLITSLVLIGGLGSVFFFTFFNSIFAYLSIYFALEVIMIVFAFLYLCRHDAVDANGEFLR